MAISEAPTSKSQQSEPSSDSVTRLLDEGLIGTSAAARLLGSFKNERPVHPSTLARWAQRGVRTPDGRIVRLESARIGGKLVTSRAAIIRFIAAQNEQFFPPTTTTRSPSERQRASEAAVRRLEDAGA